MAKTYYDGEEREILEIRPFVFSYGMQYWMVHYKRGESHGELLVPAVDELDAMRKFPQALADLSKNDDEESNKC